MIGETRRLVVRCGRGWSFARLVGVAALASVAGCGGGKPSVTPTAAAAITDAQIDADPLALLPSAPLAAAEMNARAFFQSQTFGADVARATELLLPIGSEAGFAPSRDVDRIWAGAYSTQGFDVVAALKGRFDAAKVAQAAQNHTSTRGGVLVASEYAGRTLFTVSNAGFVILTPQTALAGTEAGIRRALDRLRDGRLQRDLPTWMTGVLDATADGQPAALAVAADFTTQPIASASIGALPIPWVQGLRTVRVLGNFASPGLNVAGTAGYDDAPHAAQGEAGLKQVASIANVFAITGMTPQLRNLDVKAVDTSVQCSFAVDDGSIRAVFASLPRWLALAFPPSTSSQSGPTSTGAGGAGSTGPGGT